MKRANGVAVVSGKAWTRDAGCAKKVTLTSGGKKIATVALTGTTFRYSWRAPKGQHRIVARQTCGAATLFEATAVVR